MPFISSPVLYPVTSSPNHDDIPHTKRVWKAQDTCLRTDMDRQPLSYIDQNAGIFHQHDDQRTKKAIGGFEIDDSDSEEEQKQDRIGVRDIVSSRAPQRTYEHGVERSTDSLNTSLNAIAETLLPLPEVSTKLTMSSSKSCFSNSCNGKRTWIRRRTKHTVLPYEEIVAAQSHVAAGRARKSYYGIDIHRLIDEARLFEQEKEEATQGENQQDLSMIDSRVPSEDETSKKKRKAKHMIWTEKYRAKKFTDLVGDERIHRSVLKWLKAWDPIVFPGASRPKLKTRPGTEHGEERAHRKILLLTGPPGLGKTTLAHVCARQAGYEVQEINASDERSKDVVKGRIRDMVGTENVRSVAGARSLSSSDLSRGPKASRPICVVVDEVDGVVSGNNAGGGGGEGGFIKALVDLLILDQKNSNRVGGDSNATTQKTRKGDKFRCLRPIILICNDVYHPSLRLLRQGTMAEVIHVRKPPIDMVIPRIQFIFEKEGIPCDIDGVRSLCEATWGISSSRKESDRSNGTGEGDIRGILVVSEWIARKLNAEKESAPAVPVRLTKRWIQEKILSDLAHGGGAARSLGRGSTKELVDRVFAYNAGFPILKNLGTRPRQGRKESKLPGGDKEASAGDMTPGDSIGKRIAVDRLRELVECSGEDERVLTDCFISYPTFPYQDDNYLTKPSKAYDWLHFHDLISSLVHRSQEWELAAYLSSPIIAFHHLFASGSPNSYATSVSHPEETSAASATVSETSLLSGPRAAYHASEGIKANSSTLQHLHNGLSLSLQRSFQSPSTLSVDLLPYLVRMLHPDIKPVLVNTSVSTSAGNDKGASNMSSASVRRGAEKEMVVRSVQAMVACGVNFERGRLESMEESSAVGASVGRSATKGWIYRMNPPLDALSVFETFSNTENSGLGLEKVRYGVRQVLQQEMQRELLRRDQEARHARMGISASSSSSALGSNTNHLSTSEMSAALNGGTDSHAAAISTTKIKRNFFGQPILPSPNTSNALLTGEKRKRDDTDTDADEGLQRRPSSGRDSQNGGDGKPLRKVWISYNEGYSNAVRKGITLRELLLGL